MLLEDLLKVTEEGHPDEAPLRDALEKVSDATALCTTTRGCGRMRSRGCNADAVEAAPLCM